MQLGSSDSGNDKAGTTTRIAYDQLSEGFGPGFNGPFLIVSELPTTGDTAGLDTLSAALGGSDGVAVVTPPSLNPAKDTATIDGVPDAPSRSPPRRRTCLTACATT